MEDRVQKQKEVNNYPQIMQIIQIGSIVICVICVICGYTVAPLVPR
jgi:hypothetical protein